MNRSAPLGQLLVRSGVLSESTLAEVLEIQKTDRRRLGDLLAERNLVPPRQLAQILSYQLSCPWLSLNNFDIPRALIELVPREIAIDHTLVPVHLRDAEGRRHLYVATHDPTDEAALLECARAARMAVKPMVAITYEIRQALARYYGAPLPSLTTAPLPLQAIRAPEPTGVGEPALLRMLAPVPPLPAPRLPELPRAPKLPARPNLQSFAPAPDPSTAVTVPPRAAASTVPPRAAASTTSTLPPRTVPTSIPPRMAPAASPLRSPEPAVLVLNAHERFREQCVTATRAVGARVLDGSLMDATDVARRCQPAAIVVSDDIYAFDRPGLNRLAIEVDALLVVWSDDVEAEQLEPLLERAIQRASRHPSRAAS